MFRIVRTKRLKELEAREGLFGDVVEKNIHLHEVNVNLKKALKVQEEGIAEQLDEERRTKAILEDQLLQWEDEVTELRGEVMELRGRLQAYAVSKAKHEEGVKREVREKTKKKCGVCRDVPAEKRNASGLGSGDGI